MCDDFFTPTHPCFLFSSSSLFPSVFRREQDFFFHLFRDLLVLIETIDPSKMGGARRRKGKTTKRKKNQKIHNNNNNNASAKRRKRRSDQTRGDVFYSLSLCVSTCVYIFYYNKARAKNGFKLYILRVRGNDAKRSEIHRSEIARR